MKKIKVQDLLDLFGRMLSEHWRYEWGVAKEGCVDCSGAFVYAYRRLAGLSICHGSNTIYHESIGVSGSVPVPVYAAFKVRKWDDSEVNNKWYGRKPGDVYHIGLVSADGKHVLNAKGKKYGFCMDDLKGWDLFAPLLNVDYEGGRDVKVLYQAEVVTESGALNVRGGKHSSALKVGSVPKGATVDVLEDDDKEWFYIRYAGEEGFASSKYLKKISVNAEIPFAEEPISVPAEPENTTIMRSDGAVITLAGSWHVVVD